MIPSCTVVPSKPSAIHAIGIHPATAAVANGDSTQLWLSIAACAPRFPAAASPDVVTPELRASLWRDCGLIRDAAGLEHLLHAPHLLTRLIGETALTREESRGSHFRADFPSESDAFARHVVLRPDSEPALETWL